MPIKRTPFQNWKLIETGEQVLICLLDMATWNHEMSEHQGAARWDECRYIRSALSETHNANKDCSVC